MYVIFLISKQEEASGLYNTKTKDFAHDQGETDTTGTSQSHIQSSSNTQVLKALRNFSNYLDISQRKPKFFRNYGWQIAQQKKYMTLLQGQAIDLRGI